MKKNYFLLPLLCVSFLGFSQDFTIDFEQADPLNDLPTGVSVVEPIDGLTVYLANAVYRFQTQGGEPTAVPAGANYAVDADNGTLASFYNEVIADSNTSSNVLQMDQTGYIVLDETAFGSEDFSIGMDYMHFGHSMGGGASIFTVTGQDPVDSSYKSEIIRSNTGGFIEGFGFYDVSGDAGFRYGGANANAFVPEYNNIILAYTSADQIYKLYKNGVLLASSVVALDDTTPMAQESGEWNNRKIYIGLKGADQNQTDGNFDTYALQGDGRNIDLQKRVDNIKVLKKAVTDAEALILFNGGVVLAVDNISDDSFSAYPNPVVDYLTISSDNVSSVEIYNTLGALVSSQNTANGVDMTELSQGVYFVSCKDANGSVLSTIRVVKN